MRLCRRRGRPAATTAGFRNYIRFELEVDFCQEYGEAFALHGSRAACTAQLPGGVFPPSTESLQPARLRGRPARPRPPSGDRPRLFKPETRRGGRCQALRRVLRLPRLRRDLPRLPAEGAAIVVALPAAPAPLGGQAAIARDQTSIARDRHPGDPGPDDLRLGSSGVTPPGHRPRAARLHRRSSGGGAAHLRR